MRKPKALREGSTIGIVAPASNVDREALVQGAAELERLGYRARYSAQVFSQEYYFAGTHTARAAELMRMFVDPQIDAIFCARGGYGCHHLLQRLDVAVVRANPKIFLGYSDVTVLLQYLENQCQMVSFHGPMVAREFALGVPSYDAQNLQRCLTQVVGGQRIVAPGLETLRPGSARGRLTGGCLSLLTATLGTAWEIETDAKVLFLEDVNAKPYQVDRMLMHLRLAGKFDKLHGLVFGTMLNCRQSENQDYGLQEIILKTLENYSFPILYGLPSGHTESGSLTLPFGVEVTLNADSQYLVLEEAAVE
ncbi:MAG: LD-carboxypeptidase [Acidimicrobiia bacterium]|nr:LD-carboxypeptidase [Acidimicrobiia bacterium]